MRTAASWLLLVLATLFCIVAALGAWIDRGLLDTTEFTDTSVAVLQDPAVQQTTAAYLADQLVDDERLADRVRAALPDRLQGLAAPLAATGGELAERTALRLMQSGAFQTVWRETTSRAHAQLVTAVEEPQGTPVRDRVVLDLRPELGVLAQRLGLGLQPDGRRAVVTIIRPDQLDEMRRVVDILQKVRWIALALAVVCLAGAVLAAHDRRRGLARAGGVLVLSGLVLLIVRRVAGDELTASITANGAAGDATAATFDIVTRLLAQIAGTGIVLGACLLAGAWLAGASSWATRARGWLAPALVARPEAGYGAVLVLLAALLALDWLPGASGWLAILVYVVLALGGVTALRRQVEREAAVPAAP